MSVTAVVLNPVPYLPPRLSRPCACVILCVWRAMTREGVSVPIRGDGFVCYDYKGDVRVASAYWAVP